MTRSLRWEVSCVCVRYTASAYWVFNPFEVKASSQTSSHQTREMLVVIQDYLIELHTILNPSITKSVNTFRLMFSDDAVTQSGTGHQVEYRISISSLSLLIARASWSFVLLHAAIESRTGCNVLRILEDHSSLGLGELCDWEGESMRRASSQVALRSVCITS